MHLSIIIGILDMLLLALIKNKTAQMNFLAFKRSIATRPALKIAWTLFSTVFFKLGPLLLVIRFPFEVFVFSLASFEHLSLLQHPLEYLDLSVNLCVIFNLDIEFIV